MDKCPICGHVENKAQPVESHVMATFISRTTKQPAIFNRGEKTFTTFKEGPVDAKTGEVTKVAVEWVREDVFNAEQEAAKAPAKSAAPVLK